MNNRREAHIHNNIVIIKDLAFNYFNRNLKIK